MAYVVRQSFGTYKRGDRITDASKIPPTKLAKYCVRVADEAFTPKLAPAATEAAK